MSYLDEISGGSYYLNAFNNLLKRRQMENQMVSSSRQMPQMMGEGGGNERAPTAFDNMSNTQRASYYSDNPTMAAITQGLQKGFGSTSLGMLQNAMYPDFVAEQGMVGRGIDPATGLQVGGYGSRQAPDLQSFDIATPTPTGLYGDQFAGETAPQSRGFFESLLSNILPSSNVTLDAAPVETREVTPNPYGPVGLYGDAAAGTTSGYGGGADAPGANADGYGGGDAGFGGNSQAFNQGGMVTPERLMGRAPAPDDGYGALQGGEYVITKAAVERYGKAMMDAINNGTFR